MILPDVQIGDAVVFNDFTVFGVVLSVSGAGGAGRVLVHLQNGQQVTIPLWFAAQGVDALQQSLGSN